MSQEALAQVLRRLPVTRHPRLLVSASTADDAGVYRLDADRALVQTVDFFTPIVDDPVAYGAIAAANALSDVYAMGGRPLIALNIVGTPEGKVSPAVLAKILKGGARMAKAASCLIVGGHTIRNPEPIYGLAVTGLVSPRRLVTNAGARPGDWLVLTKPLGTGIITTGIKRGVAPPALARRAVKIMQQLNIVGAEVAERGWVRAATDVTGFGLLGHLANICRASRVSASLQGAALPAIGRDVWCLIEAGCIPGGTRQNLEAAGAWTQWEKTSEPVRWLLADAQTSGGLLLCVPSRRLKDVLALLERRRTPAAAVVGRISAPGKKLIRVMP